MGPARERQGHIARNDMALGEYRHIGIAACRPSIGQDDKGLGKPRDKTLHDLAGGKTAILAGLFCWLMAVMPNLAEMVIVLAMIEAFHPMRAADDLAVIRPHASIAAMVRSASRPCSTISTQRSTASGPPLILSPMICRKNLMAFLGGTGGRCQRDMMHPQGDSGNSWNGGRTTGRKRRRPALV